MKLVNLVCHVKYPVESFTITRTFCFRSTKRFFKFLILLRISRQSFNFTRSVKDLLHLCQTFDQKLLCNYLITDSNYTNVLYLLGGNRSQWPNDEMEKLRKKDLILNQLLISEDNRDLRENFTVRFFLNGY